MTPEAKVTAAVLRVMRSLGWLEYRNTQVRVIGAPFRAGGRLVVQIAPLPPHELGRPDWTFHHPELPPIDIEVKAPGGTLSPAQFGFLARHGAHAFVVQPSAGWTAQDVEAIIKKELDTRNRL